MSELKGVGADAEMVTNDNGGKQSKVEYAFHLIPAEAMLAIADVFAHGAERYERDNWRKIPAEEHFNHMIIHYYAWLMGDTTDNHLEHFLTRAVMCYSTAVAEKSNTPSEVCADCLAKELGNCNENDCLTKKLSDITNKAYEPKKIEPWSDEDKDRQEKFCRDHDWSVCNAGLCELSANDPNCDCEAWCEAHPAEAHAIMDKWEAEHECT